MAGASMRGGSRMKTGIKQFVTTFPDYVGKALFQETSIELTEVKKRTPVQFGELRASEHVVGPIRQWRTIYTNIVAGGPSAPYALYVHEDLEAFHKVGQAKYIESVLLESRPFLAARVAKRIELNKIWKG